MHTAPQGPPTSNGGPTSAFVQTCAASLRLSEKLCAGDATLTEFYRQTRALLGRPLDRSSLAVVQQSLISTMYLAESIGPLEPELSLCRLEDALADIRYRLKVPVVQA